MPRARILGPIIAIACSVVIVSNQVKAETKYFDLTNQAVGRMPSNVTVEDPAVYYKNRSEAISLARQELWTEAQPLLEKLTSQYPDDGDTWYLLGLSGLQNAQWQSGIDALKRAIELGVSLSRIPSGSRPSNDIMVKIAEAYSHLGDKDKSISWIYKSLEARYDDRKNLAGNENFEGIKSSKEFQVASGTYFDDSLSRDESWRADLEVLVSEIKRLHIEMYHAVDPETFQNKVDSISAAIPDLTDQEIVFEFMELIGLLGNGHNFIIPAYAKKGNFSKIPMQFYWFSDGLYVVGAEEPYQSYIGSKIISFGSTPIDIAVERVKKINPRDNEMQQLWLSPYYLSMPEVLAGLDIVKDAENIKIKLINKNGKKEKISVEVSPLSFRGFPTLPAASGSELVSNLKANDNYWYEYTERNKTVYVQFNAVQEKSSQTLKEFNEGLKKKIVESDVDGLILDLRHNAGGNGEILPPMLKTLIQFEVLKPEGKVFVVIGRDTFSAAQNLITWINQFTNAIFVGEPSGSRPNALSEAGWFKLPYSGVWGIVSSQFHQTSGPEDHRIWIAPHVPINLSSKDYFAGKDPALDAIYKIISDDQGADK